MCVCVCVCLTLTGVEERLVGWGMTEITCVPAIFSQHSHACFLVQLFCEEIFGPVAAVCKFDKDEDVMTMANDTRAGLVAYFYSQNLQRVWRTASVRFKEMQGVGVVRVV